jgi:hypothetical protein
MSAAKWFIILALGALLALWMWSALGILLGVWRRSRPLSRRELLWVLPLALFGGAALLVNAVGLVIGWTWYRLRGKPLPRTIR